MSLATRRRILMNAGGSAKKVFTKILDYTVTDPIEEITVQMTDRIKNCISFYVQYTDAAISVSDWLAVRFNTNKIYTRSRINTQAKGTGRIGISYPANDNNTAFLGRYTTDTDGVFVAMLDNTGAFSGTLESISVAPYTTGNTITAGHFEIWGWI